MYGHAGALVAPQWGDPNHWNGRTTRGGELTTNDPPQPRLEKRLRPALEAIVSRHEQAPGRWAGAREHGVQGNTMTALAARRLVETAWEKGGRRMLCRPTQAGLEEAARNREQTA